MRLDLVRECRGGELNRNITVEGCQPPLSMTRGLDPGDTVRTKTHAFTKNFSRSLVPCHLNHAKSWTVQPTVRRHLGKHKKRRHHPRSSTGLRKGRRQEAGCTGTRQTLRKANLNWWTFNMVGNQGSAVPMRQPRRGLRHHSVAPRPHSPPLPSPPLPNVTAGNSLCILL